MITYDAIVEFLKTLWSHNETRFIAAAVGINTVLAVAGAIKNGDFNLRDLAAFLRRDLVPLTLVYGGFRAFGDATGFGWVPLAAFALIVASVGARIIGQLSAFGLKAPDVLTGLHSHRNT